MVRRRARVAPSSDVVFRDFSDAELVRIRELIAEGMAAKHGERAWDVELSALFHCAGRLRGFWPRIGWQLDTWDYTLDEAVAEEIEYSAEGSLHSSRWSKYCPDCGGLIHSSYPGLPPSAALSFHIVGDRYARGCPG